MSVPDAEAPTPSPAASSPTSSLSIQRSESVDPTDVPATGTTPSFQPISTTRLMEEAAMQVRDPEFDHEPSTDRVPHTSPLRTRHLDGAQDVHSHDGVTDGAYETATDSLVDIGPGDTVDNDVDDNGQPEDAADTGAAPYADYYLATHPEEPEEMNQEPAPKQNEQDEVDGVGEAEEAKYHAESTTPAPRAAPVTTPYVSAEGDNLHVADPNRLRDLLQSASMVRPPPPPSQAPTSQPSRSSYSEKTQLVLSHQTQPHRASQSQLDLPPQYQASQQQSMPEESSQAYVQAYNAQQSVEPRAPSQPTTPMSAIPPHSSSQQPLASSTPQVSPQSSLRSRRPVPGPLNVGHDSQPHDSPIITPTSSSRSGSPPRSPQGSRRFPTYHVNFAAASLLAPKEQAKGPGFGGGIAGVARKPKPNSYLSIMHFSEKGKWQSPEEIARERERERRADIRRQYREFGRRKRRQIQRIQRRILANLGLFVAVPRGYVMPKNPFQTEEKESTTINTGELRIAKSPNELVKQQLGEQAAELIRGMRSGGIRIKDSSLFLFNLPFPFPKSLSKALKELVPPGAEPMPGTHPVQPDGSPNEGLTLIAYVAAYLRILDDLKIPPAITLRAAILALNATKYVKEHADRCAVTPDYNADYDESKDGKPSQKEQAERQQDIEADDELATAPSGCNAITDLTAEELESILSTNSLPEVRALWHALPDPPNGLALAEQYYVYMRQVLSTSFSNAEEQVEELEQEELYDIEDVDDRTWDQSVSDEPSDPNVTSFASRRSLQLPAALYQAFVLYQHKAALAAAAAAQVHAVPSGFPMNSVGLKGRQVGQPSKRGSTITSDYTSDNPLEAVVPPEIVAALASLGLGETPQDQASIASSSTAKPATAIAETSQQRRTGQRAHQQQTRQSPSSAKLGKPSSTVAAAVASGAGGGRSVNQRLSLQERREQRQRVREQKEAQRQQLHAPAGFPLFQHRNFKFTPYTLKEWHSRPAIAPPPRLGPDLSREDRVVALQRRAKMLDVATKIKMRNDELLSVYREDEHSVDLSVLPNSRDPDFLETVSPRLAEFERRRQHSSGRSFVNVELPTTPRGSSANSTSTNPESTQQSGINDDEPDMDFDDLLAADSVTDAAHPEQASASVAPAAEPEPLGSKAGSHAGVRSKSTVHNRTPSSRTPSSRTPQAQSQRPGQSSVQPQPLAEHTKQRGATPIKITAVAALSRPAIPKAPPATGKSVSQARPHPRAQARVQPQPARNPPASSSASASSKQEDALDTLVRETPSTGPATWPPNSLDALVRVHNIARQRAAEVKRSLRK